MKPEKAFLVFIFAFYITLQSPIPMKSILVLVVVTSIFQARNTEIETGVSKVICSMKRQIHTEILIGRKLILNQKVLTKKLYQECNFQVRVVSKLEANGKTDLVAFAYNDIGIKVYRYTFPMQTISVFKLGSLNKYGK